MSVAAYPDEGHPQIVAAHLRGEKRKRCLVWPKKTSRRWAGSLMRNCGRRTDVDYSVLSPLSFGGTEPAESPSAAFWASHSSSGTSTPSRSS
jgi:hypothetical protein